MTEIFSLMVWSLMMEESTQIKECRRVCGYEWEAKEERVFLVEGPGDLGLDIQIWMLSHEKQM